jgi:Fe2+ transport system protein FeoA
MSQKGMAGTVWPAERARSLPGWRDQDLLSSISVTLTAIALPMRTVLIHTARPMDATTRPPGVSMASGTQSLSVLSPGASASVVSVGSGRGDVFTPIERRLIELGFVHGEHVEVIAQAMPGGDPFVVRVGTTTFALRRREVESVWVEPAPAPTPP